jgi:ATP-dependent Clp protease ATP-binding subunit ClpC
MEAKFSQRVKDVISFSREEALRLGNDFIGVEHLLLGLIREGDGKAIVVLQEFHLDLKLIRKEIEQNLTRSSAVGTKSLANIPLVKQAERVLKLTYLEAKLYKSPMIGTEHLLLSILKNEDSVACSILNKYGVIYENVKDELESMKDDAITPRSEFPGGAEEDGGSGGGEESYSSQRKGDPK